MAFSDTPVKGSRRLILGASVAVTALTSAKVTKGAEEINLTKVGAKGFHEVKLAVGALPQHEVAEALLS